jgi:hypothetical protein
MATKLIPRNILIVIALGILALALMITIPARADLPTDGRVNLLPWVNSWGAVAVYCVPPSGGTGNNLPGGGVVVLNQKGERVMVVQQQNINTCRTQLQAITSLTTACRDQIKARRGLDNFCIQEVRAAGLQNVSSPTLFYLNNGVCILRHNPPVLPGVRTPRPTPRPPNAGPELTSIYSLYVFPNGAMQLSSLPDFEGKTFVGKWQGCG